MRSQPKDVRNTLPVENITYMRTGKAEKRRKERKGWK
jgi:hypothetical protein